MGTFHVLPIRGRTSSDQIARLTADLMTAHESGIDLGTRVPHIHAAGASLQHMVDELQCALADLQQDLESLDLHDAGRMLNRLMRETAELAAGAKRFPAGA